MDQDDLIFCYRYGKIGASGHTKLKKFKSRAEAEAELEAKLQEKLDEGFSEPDTADETAVDESDGAEATSLDDAAPKPRRKPAKLADAPVDAPPRPPPPLPDRFEGRSGAPEATARALKALEDLSRAVGKRSWHVRRRGRAARRALEQLGGIDPETAPFAAAFEPLIRQVLAPTRCLPLDIALGLLWEVDASAYKRIISTWRKKLLSSPASTSIAVLAATFDAIDDPEVAVHAGAALVDRRSPEVAWRRKFSAVRPAFEHALAKKGSSIEAFLGALDAGADPIVLARIHAAATEVKS